MNSRLEIAPNDPVIIYCSGKDSERHTNFKLNANGEYLALLDPAQHIIDSLSVPALPNDISYGRSEDGQWITMMNPTPGDINDNTPFQGLSAPPVFSHEPGIYHQNFAVTIASDEPSSKVYYTLDGSEPDEDSIPYTAAIPVNQTTVIRAVAIISAKQPSAIITKTYLMNEDTDFAIVSVITDPTHLWDWNEGIYVMGPNAEPYQPYYGANFWMDWEKPAHIEFFEPDGTLGFHADAGVKIYGAWSRSRAQKSMCFFARSKYGVSEFEYQIFPDKDIHSFEAFVLRNGGNDWDQSLFRDGMMQYLVKDRMDVPMLALRPALCFLNGEYWGILNVREKINEHYLADNENADPNSLDLVEIGGDATMTEAIIGSNQDYDDMIEYIKNHSLSNSIYYEQITKQVHIDNFMEYHIAQIYFANQDWPHNNNKFWRPTNPDGKWRWILYDTDFGFSVYSDDGWIMNTLATVTESNDSEWYVPKHSAFILANLLDNEEFQNKFINLFADHLNTTFHPNRVKDTIEAFQDLFEPELIRHKNKWPDAIKDYDDDIEIMKHYAMERPGYMREFIADEFSLSGTYSLELDVANGGAGSIQVNSIIIEDMPWQGEYFDDIPILIRALPDPGYRFISWSDGYDGAARILKVSKNASLVAEFEWVEGYAQTIVINEINYNSAAEWNVRDWVELYNPTDVAIDLSNWILQDTNDDEGFIFPPQSAIPPYGFAVVACNQQALTVLAGPIQNLFGDLEFKLNDDGDHIRLIRADGTIADSLTYNSGSPWPDTPASRGATIECIDPMQENSIASNWQGSAQVGGTPGEQNSVNTCVSDEYIAQFPTTYSLSHNYPNPFNAVTQIQYAIPQLDHVRVDIFNVTGKHINTLVDQDQKAGVYTVMWNGTSKAGSDVSTGTYLLKWTAGTMCQTRKILLLR